MKRRFFAIFTVLLTSFYINAEKITFPVLGLETVPSEPIPVELEWNEQWFGEKSSFEYNHNIARIACLFAEIAYVDVLSNPDGNEIKKSYNLLGIKDSDIEFHYDVDYDQPIQGNNQTAFSFATKKIKSAQGEKNLVFVVIRGTPLSANEWISNIAVSDSTQTSALVHEGFFHTTNQIRSALIYYLLKKQINPDETFFLITGHSRGAAISNYLGATLADEGFFDTSNLYVYTFASPNVSAEDKTSDKRYKFIWNIVNAEDVVTTVPPYRNSWKYKKFGNIKVLTNAWNTSPELYEDNYLPRINDYFTKFLLREYTPFRTGCFVPSQISRILTTINKDVESYYKPIIGIRPKAETLLWRVFPTESELGDDEDGNQKKIIGGNAGLMAKLQESLNNYTGGVFSYTSTAFVDMHACESYFSMLLALNDSEAYSSEESTHIVIGGTYNGAIYDENENLLGRIIDGAPEIKSLKTPVWIMPLPGKVSIGFPNNRKFKILIYKDSLAPTVLPVTIEHYNQEGTLYKTDEKSYIFTWIGSAVEFEAGEVTVTQTQIEPSKCSFEETRQVLKKNEFQKKTLLNVVPEVNINTDANFETGVHIGTHRFYGSALAGQGLTKFGKAIDFSVGGGVQFSLSGYSMINFELFGKNVWDLDDLDENESRYNLVPSGRISVSLKPWRRLQFFIAGVFDLHIKNFNDGAFNPESRNSNMGSIETNSETEIVPSIRFGLKF